jgi:uncharacterized protein (DUF2132 family)
MQKNENANKEPKIHAVTLCLCGLFRASLEAIVVALEAHYGWPGLAQRINIRCFASDPSVASSLKFLRKTPWAREKVEGLYLFMLPEKKRAER